MPNPAILKYEDRRHFRPSLRGLVFSGFVLALALFQSLSAWAGGPDSVERLPSLEKAVKMAIAHHPDTPKVKVKYEVSKHYYQLLASQEQLGISEEVKGHFETAVTKADERMDSDDGEVTQSAITKLKLGLSGTLNDISNFNAEINKARLNLGYWTGQTIDDDAEIPEDVQTVIPFDFKDTESYRKTLDSYPKTSGLALLKRKEAFIELNKAREKLALARKTRKLTRALLVTEVANYDFGIGDEGDLFEALVIYTRVLVGYYDTIYQFNLAVLDVQKLYSEHR